MSTFNFLLLSVLLTVGLQEILGHGMIMDPVNRSSAWRKGFDTPINKKDNFTVCGGFKVQHEENGGKCGVCGDNYASPRPRANENGGEYGTGTIVKTYTSGQRFTTTVHIDKNHEGYFEFSVCPLSRPDELETEECFDAHPVRLADGSGRYELAEGFKGDLDIDLVLPAGLSCEHCVFRWHWWTRTNTGVCDDGTESLGCGPQQNYRTCSDITIQ